MVLNKNDRYKHSGKFQASKKYSLGKSKELVKEIQSMFKPYLKECEEYEPNEKLRIHGAPAVMLPSQNLAIAPDLKCLTHDNRTFWIEVKDKAQRFFFPDTGADLHQVLGWYDINRFLNEPVLVIFKDPDYESCLPKGEVKDSYIKNFKNRWNKFEGSYYGNWLNELMKLDYKLKYPCIFTDERSREMEMNILYFHVNKMKKIDGNISNLLKDLSGDIDELKSWERQLDKTKKLILDNDIRELSF